MNCIIIEDEIPAQRIIQSYLKKFPNLELVGTFNAAIEASMFLKNETVDLIFLDINLPDISGMHFLKSLSNPPKVIMTTAYPDYAVESFEYDAIVDYLVKPISFERFYKAINKVMRLENNKSQSITKNAPSKSIYINVDKTMHKISFNAVLYVESDRNYVTIVTENKKLSYIETLKKLAIKLDDERFLQAHKSFIVNTNKIDKIAGNELFIGEKRIPIGRTFKKEILDIIK